MGMTMGSGSDDEQKGNDEEEEAVGEVGVEMGRNIGAPPVGEPQEDSIVCVGTPQEKGSGEWREEPEELPGSCRG